MRRNKYGNKKVKLDGYKFDSKKEAAYYQQLVWLKKAGEIIDFEVHPKQILQEGFVQSVQDHKGKLMRKKIPAITYTPDFIVFHKGMTEFVDVKGGKATQTGSWRLKWKMLMYQYRGNPNYIFTVAD